MSEPSRPAAHPLLTDPLLIDLRSPEERAARPLRVPSRALSSDAIEDSAHGLGPEDGPLTVVCSRGTRADLAARYLRADGLDAVRGELGDWLIQGKERSD